MHLHKAFGTSCVPIQLSLTQEAVHIQKEGWWSMNRDEGTHILSHYVWPISCHVTTTSSQKPAFLTKVSRRDQNIQVKMFGFISCNCFDNMLKDMFHENSISLQCMPCITDLYYVPDTVRPIYLFTSYHIVKSRRLSLAYLLSCTVSEISVSTGGVSLQPLNLNSGFRNLVSGN